MRVNSRQEAIQKVKDGDVLGALIIPSDLASNIQSQLEPGTVEVYYNAEDPAKRQFVENTIKAQVQTANGALTKRVAKEALQLLALISKGGQYSFLGQNFDVLGLKNAETILAKARKELPPGSDERAQLDRVIAFGRLARENLSFSDDVLAVVGEPIRVKATALNGGTTSLTSFAVALALTVSLMFITLLLAAGTLALEREENAFSRLVRGLVSKTGLLAEKAGARRGVLGRRVPGHGRRPQPVRGHRLGPLPAVARRAGGRRRSRSPRSGSRSAVSRATCGRRPCSRSCSACRSRSWRSCPRAPWRPRSTT